MKVYAVVVTFNRLAMLKMVLESVRNQSCRVNKIVVVNNSSTDGTTEWLKEQENIFVIHQKNSGGAGGFHTGIKYAYEDGADWIWTMDDDIFPENRSLEILLSFQNYSKCLHPSRFYADRILKRWNKHFDLKTTNMTLYDDKLVNYKEIVFTNTGCFEGMLIHKDIVSKIGYPDERFFIAGDDTIYGFLANQYTNVCNVRDSVMIKQKESTDNKPSPMYVYYAIRNFHLLEDYYIRLYNRKAYPFKVKMKFFLKIIYNLLLLVLENHTSAGYKYKVSKAILTGYADALRKKTYKSY